jgi:membrane associated rhomboid family serine protease
MNYNRGGMQVNLPRFTPINKILVISFVSMFIIHSIMSKLLGNEMLTTFLGLSGAGFSQGLIFQLITYPLVARGLLETIFGCLIIWFIGADLESSFGPKRYVTFILWAVVGAGLTYLFVSFVFFNSHQVWFYPLTGLGGVTNALCVAYAIMYPDRTFLFMLIFPLKTRYFCLLLIVIQLYTGLMESSHISGVLAWGHLAAMAFGFLYLWQLSSPWMQRFHAKKAKKGRAHLKIVEKKDDLPPKYWQ